jgi:hypothetical protein
MILRLTFFILAASPRVVILRASDEDARRISTDSVVSEFSPLQGRKSESNL